MISAVPSFNPAGRLRSVLAAVAVGFLVLGGHFWMIQRAGSPVPIHDQWLAEGEMLYIPAMQHRFSPGILLHPHSEHIIAPTRLLALGLFELNDHIWDVRLQMTVNAVLAAALAALVVMIASRQLGPRTLIFAATVGGGLFASALFYGNALWGFQSQFYFLLLFSIGHLDLVTRSAVFSVRWWLGLVCSLLACVSMGSGFFSAAVMVALSALTLLERPISRSERHTAWINLAVHGSIVAAMLAWLPKPADIPLDLPAAWHTLLHCLEWPQRFFTPWGAWVWLPFAIFVVTHARRRSSNSERMIFALGAWVLLQILAISLRRNSPTIVITPRYYEILALGMVANALALERLMRRYASARHSMKARSLWVVSSIGWLAFVIITAGNFAESHRRYDLAAYQAFATSQIRTVREFLQTGNVAALRSAAYPYVPHPDPEYLARLLADPTLRLVLPTELTDQPRPFLSRAAEVFRRAALGWMTMGLILLLLVCVRPAVATPAIAQP